MPDSTSVVLQVGQSLIDALIVLYKSDFVRGFALAAALCLIAAHFLRRSRLEVKTVSVNLPFALGNITYEQTDINRMVAWRMYVQLKTRKAALPFDPDTDVISEVYDSLYELFPIVRSLLGELPLSEVKRDNGVADLLLRVQNFGLRPHLTQWQSQFRRWWLKAIDLPKNRTLTPQEIQKQFPKYRDLVSDIQQMNNQLSLFADSLLLIARENRAQKPAKIKPMPPSTSVSASTH